MGSGILGMFCLVSKSMVSKNGFRKATFLLVPLVDALDSRLKTKLTKPNQTRKQHYPLDDPLCPALDGALAWPASGLVPYLLSLISPGCWSGALPLRPRVRPLASGRPQLAPAGLRSQIAHYPSSLALHCLFLSPAPAETAPFSRVLSLITLVTEGTRNRRHGHLF